MVNNYNSDSPWAKRIKNANKEYQAWENRFRCKTLEQYYEGFQWKGKRDFLTVNYQPYTINLCYSTIKIKMASMIFQKPQFILSPRAGNSGWDLDFAVKSTNIKQDVLNTIIQNPNANFAKILKRACLDSFMRFGIVETGYAADWRNPQKEPPLLASHDNPELENTAKDRRIFDEELPVNERFYFKRINPKRFRVAVGEAQDLNDTEWCGYYDFYYTASLRKIKGIKFPNSTSGNYVSEGNTSGYLANSLASSDSEEVKRLAENGEICKVWHIWDLIAKKRLLLMDETFDVMFETDIKRHPFTDLRWDERLEGFYPIPPMFQWISSQDEINEAREQTRSFRRRFTRKFQYVDGTVDELEIEKFTSGPDGVVIKVSQQDAITPIQNPEQGVTAENALVIAKDDFNIISGTSAEARGSADRETATSAKITDARSQIRESADQMDFSNFACLIGREALYQAQEHLIEGMWIKDTSNIGETILSEVQANSPIFRWIKSEQIDDGYDFDIEVDIMNATPAAMAAAEQSFVKFITIVQQFPAISMSPILIREAAKVCGYRNEKVINQMQQAALLSMAAKAAQMGGGPQVRQLGLDNNPGQATVEQMATPGLDQIQQQLTNQLQ